MFLEKTTLSSLAETKMIAEIVSVTHPEIEPFMRECTYEDIRKIGKHDNILGIKEFLIHNGVSPEAISRFLKAFSERLMRMNTVTLMYDYFQLDHVQKKVRQLARRNSTIRAFTKGRELTDLEWSFVSSRLGEFMLNKPYPFRPELVNIHYLYETTLGFAMKDADLYNSDFAKLGLNQDIGESTLTLLHNQRETIDLDSIVDDMTDFKRVSNAILKASRELWRHSKQGSSRDSVIYDLVSRLQDNTILQIQDSMIADLRRRTKGRTSLAPSIVYTKTHGIEGGATSNTQKILDNKVNDRETQLKPLDALLKGITSSKDIYEARVEFFALTNNVTSKDGRQIYRGLSIDDDRVDQSLNLIVEGYAALKELLDFCRRSGYNFLRLPTYAFRDYNVAKRYDSIKNYVEFVEISLKLERESKTSQEFGLKSNEAVFGEDLLEIRNQLKSGTIGDIYLEEEFKDLTFIKDWMAKGHYNDSPNHKIFRVLLHYLPINKQIWENLRTKEEYVTLVNGYQYKFNGTASSKAIYHIWMKYVYKDKLPKLSEEEKWSHFNKVIVGISKSILSDTTASDDSCYFMYLRFSYALGIMEGILRPFVRTLVKVEEDLTVLRSEYSIFRLFHENPKIMFLLYESVSYEGISRIIEGLGLDFFYNYYTESSVVDNSLNRVVNIYLNEYSRIIDYLRFVYKKYVLSVEESFTTMSKVNFEVDDNALIDISYKIYNLPPNEESRENIGFSALLQSCTVDGSTGILMDKTGTQPITVSSGTTRVTYIHEYGYYLEVYSPTIIMEKPILKGDNVFGN